MKVTFWDELAPAPTPAQIEALIVMATRKAQKVLPNRPALGLRTPQPTPAQLETAFRAGYSAAVQHGPEASQDPFDPSSDQKVVYAFSLWLKGEFEYGDKCPRGKSERRETSRSEAERRGQGEGSR